MDGRPTNADGSPTMVHPTSPLRYSPVRPAFRRTTAEVVTFFRRTGAMCVDLALPRGDGQPVLVVPGLGRGDGHTEPMRRALDQLGYRTFGWSLGANLGPTPRTLAGLEAMLTTLHARHGFLDVVGFSLGGVFARLLAHLHPDKVRQVATVCSPFREVVDSAFLPLRPFLRAWQTPNLLEIAARAAGPLPVPGTFVFSRNDGIVAWESCIEPTQPEDCFEIPGSHVALTRDADVLGILAHRLVRTFPKGSSGRS